MDREELQLEVELLGDIDREPLHPRWDRVLTPRPTRQLGDGVEGGLRELSCWHMPVYQDDMATRRLD